MSANTRSVALSLCLGFTAFGCDSASDGAKPTSEATAESSKDEPFQVVRVENSGDLPTILATHVAKAKAAGLQPYAELWASWCPPCKAIEASMGDPRMREAFTGAYVIQLDSDHWGPKLEGAGLSAASIPVFYALDSNGKPTGRKVDGGAWGDNTPENMAPPLKAFFQP